MLQVEKKVIELSRKMILVGQNESIMSLTAKNS